MTTDPAPAGGGPRPPPAPRETRRWLLVGLAAAFAWVAYLATLGPQAGGPDFGPPTLEGTALNGPAEFDWTLRDLDDAPVAFSRFRGRPIVLNLWATWCPPCREEMPSLARLADDAGLKAKGVEIVCVSVAERAEAVRGYANGKGWGMTLLRADAIPPVFLTEGIPATFVIAPDGRVVASTMGPARWDDPSVVAFLEKLAGPPG